MEQPEFDAKEVIAGFPLASIKRALTWVGLMDDRDDIKNVAQALHCPSGQAERVLEALERRGLVTKAAHKRQWETTSLGKRLNYHWHPPRRIEPVIEREAGRGAINEVFDSVPCSILRTSSDDGGAFEEADLEIGVFVEYESDRVIEANAGRIALRERSAQSRDSDANKNKPPAPRCCWSMRSKLCTRSNPMRSAPSKRNGCAP